MDELISRKALIAEYDRAHVGPPGGARALIQNAPAVGAVPVVHGRWEVYMWSKELMCSECKATIWNEDALLGLNYCPNCGAKMDEEASIE